MKFNYKFYFVTTYFLPSLQLCDKEWPSVPCLLHCVALAFGQLDLTARGSQQISITFMHTIKMLVALPQFL